MVAKKAAPKAAPEPVDEDVTATQPTEPVEPVQHEHGDYSEYMNDADPDYDAPEQNAKVTS